MTNNEQELIKRALAIESTILQEKIKIHETNKSVREMSGLVTINELPFGFRAGVGMKPSELLTLYIRSRDIVNPIRLSFWPHAPLKPLDLPPELEEADYTQFFTLYWKDRSLRTAYCLAVNIACIEKEGSLITK